MTAAASQLETISPDLALQIATRTAQAGAADGVTLITPEGGRPAHRNHDELAPGDGVHELLTTITSGEVYGSVERFDSIDLDGTSQPSTLEVGIFPTNPIEGEKGSIAIAANDLGDVAKICTAAAEFVRIYREVSEFLAAHHPSGGAS
ncbi:hypothetical protein MTX80_15405 [Gordonia amicalis]|nr:hypothetical protein [Gordonia amicalis]UOG20517.1 hypothetical protein MTX80_15405 [Gordonia amicalis]